MVSGLIALLITVLVVALIAGLVIYLIRLAPFIPEPLKSWCEYAVYVIAILVIILRALPLLGVAVAHEAPLGWQYDGGCCSSVDCREVGTNDIGETPAGYVIRATGEIVPYQDPRIHDSKDEYFHWCSQQGKADTKTICLYRPPRGL